MANGWKFCILLAVIWLIVNVNAADEDEEYSSMAEPDNDDLEGAGIVLIKYKNENVESPFVKINDGILQGVRNKTVGKGKIYYSFRGIRYAEPPIDDLRFRAPVKASNWTGIHNATYDRSICVQGSSTVTGSEDCLYINVYVPETSNRNMSVMVWIYGGAFTTGQATYSNYGPDYLLDEDVVFVSFNYRLGVFGWISTEDLACPGNWGLKDQILALKWVKDNIHHFYGNPDKITIFGESAGAVSVSCLLQSSQTTGLINAAIMESGTSLNLWGRNVRAREIAFSIGLANNIITTNATELIEKLRGVNYKDLQTKSYTAGFSIFLTGALKGLPFGPVLEPDHEDAAFVNLSYNSLLEGNFHQVPMIIGHNSNEAAAIGDFTFIIKLYLLYYNINIYDLAPHNITTNFLQHYLAGLDVNQHYFGLLLISLNENNVLRFANDDQFYRPIRAATNLTSAYTNVYHYVFSHVGELAGIENRNFTGVGHAEELKYIFVSSNNATDSDKLTRKRMAKLWTNFAKYYNPTPEKDSLFQNLTWPVVEGSSNGTGIQYLNINTTLSIAADYAEDGWEYYLSLFSNDGGDITTFDTY